MNVDDGAAMFWKYAEKSDAFEAIADGDEGIAIGIDQLQKRVVMVTPGAVFDMTVEMARAIAAALVMSSDAVQQLIAKNN
jgi:hypothetical protein